MKGIRKSRSAVGMLQFQFHAPKRSVYSVLNGLKHHVVPIVANTNLRRVLMASFQSQVNEQAMQQAAMTAALCQCLVESGVVDPHELERVRLRTLANIEQRHSAAMERMRGWVPAINEHGDLGVAVTGDET